MENKKQSFVLHIDALAVIEELTLEQRGELLTAIYNHQTGKGAGELSQVLKIAFVPFRNQFERDNIKYQKACETNRLNALSGKAKPAPAAPVAKPDPLPIAEIEKEKDEPAPEAPVNGSDKKRGIGKEKSKDIVNVSEKFTKDDFLELFNRLKKVHYPKSLGTSVWIKTTNTNFEKILKYGFKKADFERAINEMLVNQWVRANSAHTPEHLLREENFTRYLNMANDKAGNVITKIEPNKGGEITFKE